MQGIEVPTGEQKRRRYTAAKKSRFVVLFMQPGSSVSLVARQYGITPSLLFKEKRLMNDTGQSAIAAGDEVVSVSEVKALEKKVKQREQMRGRKSMEAEIIRDVLEIAQSKKLILRMHCCPRTISAHPNNAGTERCHGLTFMKA
ncbi:MAG: transposase [Serratia symbiotica]|nr:transposase [Serratia symbiotica]